MADNIFTRANAALANYFSKPTLLKGTPSFAVAGADLSGLSLTEWVQIITLIYTALLIVGAIPNFCRGLDFLKKHFFRKDK